MSETYGEHGEYLLANKESFEMVIVLIDRLLEETEGVTRIRIENGRSRIIDGGIQPSDIRLGLADETLPDDWAEAMAGYFNLAMLDRASIEALALITSYELHRLAEQIKQDPAVANIDEPSQEPAYDALFESVDCHDAAPSTQFEVSKLSIVPDDGTPLERYTFSELLAGDQRKVTMTVIKSQITSVIESMPPQGTMLVQDWIERFDPLLKHIKELMQIIAARFTDEQRLDMLLSDLWLTYQGTALEEEIGPFLDDLKIAALTEKTGRQMNRQFATNLPSMAKIQDITALLNDQLGNQ